MAASYPAGFDTMSDPAPNLSGPPLHSTMHNQINDVIEAIEAELGLTPSGADATVAATLAALPARYVPLAGGVLLTSNIAGIVTATFTDITWDTEVSDPDGWHAGVGAPLVVPAGKGGRYAITCLVAWTGTTGTIAGITMWINGATTYQTAAPGALNADYSNTLSIIRTLAAGDTIKFQCYQSSGSNRNIGNRLEIAPI